MAAEKKMWNRKERKELARRLQSADLGLDVVHPMRLESILAINLIMSRFGQIGTHNRCDESAVSLLTCIASPTG